MAGTGEFDVIGTIPFDDIPQAYNPPDNILWSANQRQVTSSYPYYIGTASNFFDSGYRANEIHRVLSQPGKLSADDMSALQTDTRDSLAAEIVPVLLQSLSKERLNAKESAAVDLLRSWDFRMETSSAAATIWWYFWGWYLDETFKPWWKSRAVPVDYGVVFNALGQDLEAWTLHDPGNRAFSAPGVGSCTAPDALRKSFHRLIGDAAKLLGPEPRSWSYGKVHQRVLENLAQISGLNYGPRPDRADLGLAAVRLYIGIVLAAALALAGVLLDVWWSPFVVGLALGAADRRARVAVPVGAAIGLLAWAIPLAAVHIQYGLGPTAQ